jgi:hypothetical protein
MNVNVKSWLIRWLIRQLIKGKKGKAIPVTGHGGP